MGTTLQFIATGTYSDGSTLNLTTTATWSSADQAIATVNGQGVASSVAAGSTSITATSGTISGIGTVTVTTATLVSIAVTPAIPALPSGITQQFTATGTFTDSSTQNITTTVQWNSDTPTVATISNTQADHRISPRPCCREQRHLGYFWLDQRIDQADGDLGISGFNLGNPRECRRLLPAQCFNSSQPEPIPMAAPKI